MKADTSYSKLRRALHLFRETRTCSRPLFIIRCRDTQYIRGVNDNCFRFDLRLSEGFLETLHAIRIDVRLVAVEFRNCREELHCGHVSICSAADSHVDAAVIYCMSAEKFFHMTTFSVGLVTERRSKSARYCFL